MKGLFSLFFFVGSLGSVYAQDDLSALNAKLLNNLEKQQRLAMDQFKAGSGDYKNVVSTKRALAEFKRDQEKSIEKKIEIQKEIIKISEEYITFFEDQMKGGAAGIMDILKAEESLLKAKLVLQELQGKVAQ